MPSGLILIDGNFIPEVIFHLLFIVADDGDDREDAFPDELMIQTQLAQISLL